jgi:Monogalactosyldiacylglycerol synthase (EC 2.4.1.46)
MVSGLMQSPLKATLIVVAGRNTTLVESLSDFISTPNIELRVLGFIDYVDDLITASDLVITKAGGLIVSEVMARGTPMIIVDPILGQEEWNADYVVSTGSGIQLRMCDSAPRAVLTLLNHPTMLAEMRRCAQAAAHPRAALDIAEKVIADLAHHVHD